MAAPPTSDLGRPDLIWGTPGQGLMSDWLETTPDLIWPLTVRTYGRMRRDPQLTAILSSYALPIRRATWAVDPAGCRDEVVQQVADDLGLQVLGTDAKPGPARRRGVSWSEHLRLALLQLVYGHMPFERRYEMHGQRARLVNLGERLPHTITDISVNTDGTLQSIRQEPTGAVNIPGSRLVWYVHEREGANWAGTSVLRPTYGAWLLKHELWRVHATSIRRFGMGVPNVEAPPGATPAQVLEAQRLAAAMRVGDQSGAGLPSGFKLNITGMTGSVPDAMEMIRYLDQQMSTMALAGLIDLGSTTNGSRALGDTFLELFLLSLQAVADSIADIATSGHPGMPGIVTDLVDVNWGTDEPAPRIVCTDVGERHELHVDAINGLIASGALTADPDLEAYLRGTYRLPPRAQEDAPSGASYQYDLDFGILTINERRAQIGLPPIADGDRVAEPASVRAAPEPEPQPQPEPEPEVPPAPVQARARRRGRAREVRAAGDPAADHRQLSTLEAASGMDPDGIQDDWQTELDGLVEDWADIAAEQRTSLREQIVKAITTGALVELGGLVVDAAAAAVRLVESMLRMAATALKRMTGEAESQGVTIPASTAPDEEWLTEVATTVAETMARTSAAAAGREALRVATPGRSGEEVAELVDAYWESLTDAWLVEQLGGALTASQNHGRLTAAQAAPKKARYAASEVLDRNTCEPCREIDGEEFASADDAAAAYATGGYIDCKGRLRCRGILIALWD